MGKGIVKNGGGGMNPTIIVTDPTNLGMPGTGDTSGLGTVGSVSGTPTVSAVAVNIEFGTELPCSSAIPIANGDLVDFSFDGAKGVVNSKESSGQLITGTFDQKLNVTATSAALIVNANVSGKITCNGGVLAIVGTSVVDGKVDIDNGSKVFIGKGVKVSGKVDSLSLNSLTMIGAIIDGKTVSINDLSVTITGCTVEGKLEVSGAQSCSIKGNTVSGKVVAGPPCVVS